MQDRAVAYCNQTKAQPLSWQLCLEKYSSTAYMEVRFWCLQTLHEVFPALPSTHQHQSEVLLLLWQLHAGQAALSTVKCNLAGSDHQI